MQRLEEPHVISRKERNELGENSLWIGSNLHHDDWRCGYRMGEASLATEINVLLMALKTVLNDPKDESANRWIIINMMSDLCASHSFEPEQRQIDRLSDFGNRQSANASAEPASAEPTSQHWYDRLKAKLDDADATAGSGTELDQKKN